MAEVAAAEVVLSFRCTRRIRVFLAFILFFPSCRSWSHVLLNDDFGGYAEIRKNTELQFDEEVATPVEVDEDELPISHSTHLRHKRSTSDGVKYFTLDAFGEHFNLKLMPNAHLLAPNFKVYHRDGRLMQEKKESNINVANCFYSGTLKKSKNSIAALNLCGGLSGLIKTENSEILIQPMTTNISHDKQYLTPHVLQKRSLHQNGDSGRYSPPEKRKQQTHFCGKKRRYMPHKPHRKNYWLPNEFGKETVMTRRPKRSIALPEVLQGTKKRLNLQTVMQHRRNVETLVVADQEMVHKHGTENVTMYILTVFNMVSMLYQDSTIGNNVSVVLVGLVLLEGDEPGLSITHNAEHSLSSFCQWQSTIHTSKGTQHDHAVLLTGLDICSWKDAPCDTLGYAPISGMCSKYRSCTVNEDSGLALAFTVAHEVGHNFGMIHDGQGSACKQNRGTIMSPSLSGLDTSVLWSTCSQHELAKFLE